MVLTTFPCIAAAGILEDPIVSAILFAFGCLARLLAEENMTVSLRRATSTGLLMLGRLWERALGLKYCTFKSHVSPFFIHRGEIL